MEKDRVSVSVGVRLREMTSKEFSKGEKSCWSINSDK